MSLLLFLVGLHMARQGIHIPVPFLAVPLFSSSSPSPWPDFTPFPFFAPVDILTVPATR